MIENSMRFMFVLLLFSGLVACVGSEAQAEISLTPAPSSTSQIPKNTTESTDTPLPQDTPAPTVTIPPEPSITLEPTLAPTPVITPTPTSQLGETEVTPETGREEGVSFTDVLVVFQVTGGIAGFHDKLVIMEDGHGTLAQPANGIEFQLRDSELQTLNSILDQIAFGSLPSRYESPDKVDNLEYMITHDGITVSVQDGAAPAELEPLIAFLNKIIVGLF